MAGATAAHQCNCEAMAYLVTDIDLINNFRGYCTDDILCIHRSRDVGASEYFSKCSRRLASSPQSCECRIFGCIDHAR